MSCGSNAREFLDFGRMPIANGFLRPQEFAAEYLFSLRVAFCPACSMVQLAELVDRERMFHDNYAFFSSTSRRMAEHFAELAAAVRARYVRPEQPLVVELGSNDGILLRHFADAGIPHLGVEPSANVAQAARDRGVNTWVEFFDEAVAERIVAEYGHADVLIGANVLCHIPYIHDVLAGVRTLLKPSGVLVFEDPYIGDVVAKTSYDQIYDEHAFYFSLASVSHMVAQHGLEVVDAAPQAVHGGSMRYVIGRTGAHPIEDRVGQLREQEAAAGLHLASTYDRFRGAVERSRDALVTLLRDVRGGGARVVGYGATSKSTTVTNYCGLTPDLVECVVDTTPIKQGKYSPGTHIPIRPHETFTADYPDYGLLFAWNHADEILSKERPFTEAGGRWIVYVPEVGIA
jgi:methylation protein EvaC